MTKMLNILLHKEVLTSVRKEIQLKMDQVPDKAIHKRYSTKHVCRDADRQTRKCLSLPVMEKWAVQF